MKKNPIDESKIYRLKKLQLSIGLGKPNTIITHCTVYELVEVPNG